MDLKFLANENLTFRDRRFSSPGNFNTLISFLNFSWWFLENESIMPNPCACSLNSPFLDPTQPFTKASKFNVCSRFASSLQFCLLSNTDTALAGRMGPHREREYAML
jgi:hypothetical protein